MPVKKRVTLLRLFAVLLALYVVLEWCSKRKVWRLFSLSSGVVGVILGVRLIRRLIRKSIWRLRNRLIVTYVFIGVVPIILILALAVLERVIVVGQVAVYLVSSELERRAAVLTELRCVHSEPGERLRTAPPSCSRWAISWRSHAGSRDRRERSDRHVCITLPEHAANAAAPAMAGRITPATSRRTRLFYSASRIPKAGGTTRYRERLPSRTSVLENTVPGIGALTTWMTGLRRGRCLAALQRPEMARFPHRPGTTRFPMRTGNIRKPRHAVSVIRDRDAPFGGTRRGLRATGSSRAELASDLLRRCGQHASLRVARVDCDRPIADAHDNGGGPRTLRRHAANRERRIFPGAFR